MERGENVYCTCGASSAGSLPYQINILRTGAPSLCANRSDGCRVKTCLVQLGEILDGANHLRGVAVLVVVPGHDLHLVGVEAAKRLPVRLSVTSNVGKKCELVKKTITVQSSQGLSYRGNSLSYHISLCKLSEHLLRKSPVWMVAQAGLFHLLVDVPPAHAGLQSNNSPLLYRVSVSCLTPVARLINTRILASGETI